MSVAALEKKSKKEHEVEIPEDKTPRCLKIAQKGIKTGTDFASMMSALMSDLVEGRVTPNVGNATCNAGGKLLKVVEMQYKYGTDGPGQTKKLLLAVEEYRLHNPHKMNGAELLEISERYFFVTTAGAVFFHALKNSVQGVHVHAESLSGRKRKKQEGRRDGQRTSDVSQGNSERYNKNKKPWHSQRP